MTQNDVIKLAREAGWLDWEIVSEKGELIRFAQSLIAAERNRLADELQKMPLNDTANSIAIWIRGQE